MDMTKEELLSEYLKKWLNGDIYHSASHSPSNCFHDGFLSGYSAAESEIKKRDALIEKLVEALEYYAKDSIDHHEYHALMNTTLTTKAREALEKLRSGK